MSDGFRLQIFMGSGAQHVFEHDDPEVTRRNSIWLTPDHLLVKPTLEIAGEHHTTVLRTEEIARIELTQETPPDWPLAPRIESAELIDEAAFRELVHQRENTDRASRVLLDGQEVEGVIEIEDSLGGRHYLHLKGEVMPQMVRAGILREILEVPTLSVRRGATAVLFRTAHLASITAYPGMPELPYDALIAHRSRGKS